MFDHSNESVLDIVKEVQTHYTLETSNLAYCHCHVLRVDIHHFRRRQQRRQLHHHFQSWQQRRQLHTPKHKHSKTGEKLGMKYLEWSWRGVILFSFPINVRIKNAGIRQLQDMTSRVVECAVWLGHIVTSAMNWQTTKALAEADKVDTYRRLRLQQQRQQRRRLRLQQQLHGQVKTHISSNLF